jgi:hypothetical protein
MAFLSGFPFPASHQILLSNHHLAAIGAGILFLLEGALIGALVLPRRATHAKAPGSEPRT